MHKNLCRKNKGSIYIIVTRKQHKDFFPYIWDINMRSSSVCVCVRHTCTHTHTQTIKITLYRTISVAGKAAKATANTKLETLP